MKKITCLLAIAFTSCSVFLDEKPSKDLVVPTTAEDFQAILDNNSQMNASPGLSILTADEQYLTDVGWQNLLTEMERKAYVWSDDLYQGESFVPDWNAPFRAIFNANVVLDGIHNLQNTTDSPELQQLKGSAYFYRAYANYQLLELFAPAYSKETATGDLGIPLKLTPRIDEPIKRSNLQSSYNAVFEDLDLAFTLLPQTASYVTRPSKIAVEAFKARIYLDMGDFENARTFSKKVLQTMPGLMDYNLTGTNTFFSFPRFNEEVIFHAFAVTYSFRSSVNLIVSDTIYNSYEEDDLRQSRFFRIREGNVNFFGNYTGNLGNFTGLAVNEMYLINAEAEARLGNFSAGLEAINILLQNRWESGKFEPFEMENEDILPFILNERKKELVYRGRRWTDLKRLNLDPQFASSLKRSLNGETFILPPNDPRYVFQIPDLEVEVHGLEQNPR